MSESRRAADEGSPSASDASFFEAVGRVTVSSAFLEYTVALLLHGLAGLDQRRGRIVAADNFDRQLKNIRVLAKIQIEDPELLERLNSWVTSAGNAYRERNDIVHGAWTGTTRLPKRVGGELTTWTVADIEAIAHRLANAQREMNRLLVDVSRVTPGPWAVRRASGGPQEPESPPQRDAETGSL